MTTNLQKRIKEHNLGKSFSTSFRKPFKSIYSELCLNLKDAKKREDYLKTTQGQRFLAIPSSINFVLLGKIIIKFKVVLLGMHFPVPQFIEYETKLVGPLTVKQALFIIIPGGVCFLLYLAFARTNFLLFLFPSILIMGAGISLAFVRIAGKALPEVLVNFFRFNISPKVYLWTKKERPIMIFELKKKEVKKIEEELPLKIAEGSRLRKVRTQIETQTK